MDSGGMLQLSRIEAFKFSFNNKLGCCEILRSLFCGRSVGVEEARRYIAEHGTSSIATKLSTFVAIHDRNVSSPQGDASVRPEPAQHRQDRPATSPPQVRSERPQQTVRPASSPQVRPAQRGNTVQSMGNNHDQAGVREVKRSIYDCRDDGVQNREELNNRWEEVHRLSVCLDEAIRDKLPEDQIHVIQMRRNQAYILYSGLASVAYTAHPSLPPIADLSDPLRASSNKVRDAYSELYDNQWSDAFEFLNNDLAEQEAIDYLLKILFQSYVDVDLFFQAEIEGELKRRYPDKELNELSVEERGNVEGWIKGKLVDQQYVTNMKNDIFKRVAENFRLPSEYSDDENIKEYIMECARVCAYFVVQEPKVVFGSLPNRESKFDAAAYKSYTKKGSHVDFVVWPALYMYEKGGMLNYGVMQGK